VAFDVFRGKRPPVEILVRGFLAKEIFEAKISDTVVLVRAAKKKPQVSR
jgi:hypothetical protein